MQAKIDLRDENFNFLSETTRRRALVLSNRPLPSLSIFFNELGSFTGFCFDLSDEEKR